MKWGRLTWDHRFLQMMLALYIPSLCLGGIVKTTHWLLEVFNCDSWRWKIINICVWICNLSFLQETLIAKSGISIGPKILHPKSPKFKKIRIPKRKMWEKARPFLVLVYFKLFVPPAGLFWTIFLPAIQANLASLPFSPVVALLFQPIKAPPDGDSCVK